MTSSQGQDPTMGRKKGKQDYVTPMDFLDLVEARFSIRFVLDIAASPENARRPAFYTQKDDALKQRWQFDIEGSAVTQGIPLAFAAGWLNPEFNAMRAFAPYCAEMAQAGARFATLTLNSTASGWYRNYVQPNAMVFELGQRLTFEGQKYPFDRDLMLSLWGMGMVGHGWWDWRKA
jgi:hypothetical protein